MRIASRLIYSSIFQFLSFCHKAREYYEKPGHPTMDGLNFKFSNRTTGTMFMNKGQKKREKSQVLQLKGMLPRSKTKTEGMDNTANIHRSPKAMTPLIGPGLLDYGL